MMFIVELSNWAMVSRKDSIAHSHDQRVASFIVIPGMICGWQSHEAI